MNPPFWLQLVLVIASTCQLTEVFRHGAILARFRAWLESRGSFWEELVGCSFCFSHWAAALAVLLLLGHNLAVSMEFAYNPFLLMLIWLTATRGANLLNDLTKRWNRSPSADDVNVPLIEMTDDEPEDLNDVESTESGAQAARSELD